MTGAEVGVSEPRTASTAKKTKRGKKKTKDKDLDVPLGPRLTSAPAPAGPFYVGDLLDDSWADQRGDGVSPHVLADAAPFPAAMPAAPGGPRRVLAQRVSRERTPPPRGHRQFAVGAFVMINGLERRSELNGTCGTIIKLVSSECIQFVVKLVSSECIRAKESNLTLVTAPGCETSSLSSASTGAVQSPL